MAELKTKVNDASVTDFINSVDNKTRKQDAFVLLDLYTRVTGLPAKMWGSSIIGFGMYHYKSERSSQEGDWPLAGFSPRKQNLTLYIMPEWGIFDDLLAKLGKHGTSKACLYINKLADVDMTVLEKIVALSFVTSKERLGGQ